MKRLVTALVLAALLLMAGGGWATAHELALFAHVSVDPQGELTVRIVDIYGAAVEGQQVLASAAAPGSRPTKAEPLKEEPAGTYRGVVTVPGADRYTVTVDVTLVGDLHRVTYDVKAGEAKSEQRIAMEAIDPPAGVPWSRVLYMAAAGVLVAATAVALLKKKPAAEGE